MFSQDDLLPISALQHLAFCERQCALIHIERMWEENRLTAEGRILHERGKTVGNGVSEEPHEPRMPGDAHRSAPLCAGAYGTYAVHEPLRP